MAVFTAASWPEYDSTAQTVSELSAIGAPTRTVWILLAIPYACLIAAFGIGIIASAKSSRNIRILGRLIFSYALFCLFWPPMHLRSVLAAGGSTISDTLHILFTVITVVLMIASIYIAASEFGKVFRAYSILTIITLMVFGVLTGIQAPNVHANLPTPLMGVWERINIGVFLLWIIVLSFVVQKRIKIGI